MNPKRYCFTTVFSTAEILPAFSSILKDFSPKEEKMFSRIFLSFLLASVSISCFSSQEECTNHHYTLLFDTNLTESEKYYTVRAADEWSEKVGFTYHIENGKFEQNFETCRIQIVAKEDPSVYFAWADTRYNSKNDHTLKSGNVTIFRRRMREETVDEKIRIAVMLHEFGHLMSLSHVEDDNIRSVMHSDPFKSIAKLECFDIETACQVWECAPNCK